MVVLSIGAKTAATTTVELPYELEEGVFEVTQSWCQANEGIHLIKFKKSGGRDLFPSGRSVVYTSTYTSADGWTPTEKHESTMPVSASGYNLTTSRVGMVHAEQMVADTSETVHEVGLELSRADGSSVGGLAEWGLTMIAPPVIL